MSQRAAALVLVGLSSLLSPLSAQSRDSLAAGRRAYESVDYAAAARLLPIGLAGAALRDSAWAAGVHMLTDVLLEQGNDSLARLWARWATRAAPEFPIDSTAFPPRVTATLTAARSALAAGPADSAVAATLEPAGEVSAGRGQLRLARGSGVAFAVIEGVGTILPGESRALAPGTYTLRITADGAAPLVSQREVLPGFATTVTRLVRSAATAAGPSPGAGRPAAPVVSTGPAVRGSLLGAAGATTCVILETGRLACWGDDDVGQLGGGFADSAWSAPVVVAAEDPVRAVSVGATHVCALTAAGKAYCWGLGTSGELGTGQSVSSSVPAPVAGGQIFVQLAAGGRHTCGLSRAGAVLCWGANTEGQLGNRTSASSATPTAVAVPGGASFTAIVAGVSHSCALASNGSAYCWGANATGQLGNGSTSDANAPVLVQAGVAFRTVAAGGGHTCALAATGAAYCWGANAAGQVGTGLASESERAGTVTGGLVFDSLVAGEAHSCGLTADGAAYCWGAGRSGQLGNGQAADSPRPVLVVGGHVFKELRLGLNHSCGLASDAITRCWGSNAQGQLGSLAGRAVSTPVPVVIRPPARAVSSGLFVIRGLGERFSDGDFTAGPAWSVDSARGARIAVAGGTLEVSRQGARGATAAAGLALPLRVPITRATQIQFDVQVLADSTRLGCGLNCAFWPALVRLRVKNNDLTESEVWYAFSDAGGSGRTLGSVVVVGKGDVPPGQWLREQRFTVRDAAPRADTILQISLGGIGGDFAARFDNVFVPVPALASIDVKPDTLALTRAAPQPLRATARDATNGELPWIRVSWSSSDTSVARVDSTGLVIPVKAGRAWIRATAGTIADSTRVSVRLTPTPVRRTRRP